MIRPLRTTTTAADQIKVRAAAESEGRDLLREGRSALTFAACCIGIALCVTAWGMGSLWPVLSAWWLR